jgi:hypothetical protein
MDPPAAEGMYRFPSVNSLKLEAGADDGLTTYLGNDIDRSTGVSRPEADGGLDSLNNVQMIIVNNPEVGIWTIRVSTKSVWTGDEPRRQGYALAISGGIDVAGFLVGPIT